MTERIAAALLTLSIAASCTDEQLRPSVAEEIVGAYYLGEVSGGIAGTTETYTPAEAPVTIAFGDDGTYRYIRTLRDGPAVAVDTFDGEWFMTEVARRGVDTFDFRFTNQLPQQLSGAKARLVAGRELFLCDEGISDGFCYSYLKQ